MNILFCDVDGVFTSARTGWYNWDIYAVNFVHWICWQAPAKIVVSSTWRKNHNRDFFFEIFGKYLHEDYETPVIYKSDLNRDVIRGDDLRDWLGRHPETNSYLILDDDRDFYAEQLPFLVHTDGENGLTFKNMMQMRDFFGIKAIPKDNDPLYQSDNMFANHRRKLFEQGKEYVPRILAEPPERPDKIIKN